MHDLTAKRTLVKSPPELWSELSEGERLARHLRAFGEIKITKLEPEHTVAWEGEAASGTVLIEPSGWGTRVTLSAQVEAGKRQPEPPEEPRPEPRDAPPEEGGRQTARKPGFFARLIGWGTRDEAVAVKAEPQPEAEPLVDAEPQAVPASDEAQAVLEEALEALGLAHHRPFSRG